MLFTPAFPAEGAGAVKDWHHRHSEDREDGKNKGVKASLLLSLWQRLFELFQKRKVFLVAVGIPVFNRCFFQ